VAIAAPFLVLVLVAVALTAGLAIDNGEQVVTELTEQLLVGVNHELKLELEVRLESARRANRTTATAIARDGFDRAETVRALEPTLFDTLQVFPELDAVGVARDTDGAAIVVSRDTSPAEAPSDTYFVEYADASTGRDFWSFRIDSQRRQLDRGMLKIRDLDVRERPWYAAARDRDGAGWSALYPSLDRASQQSAAASLAVNANLPLRDADGGFSINGSAYSDDTTTPPGSELPIEFTDSEPA